MKHKIDKSGGGCIACRNIKGKTCEGCIHRTTKKKGKKKEKQQK